MTQWWTSRAPREQLLLIIAAIVLVGALIAQFVAVPSLRARAAAKEALQQGASTVARLDHLQSIDATYQQLEPDAVREPVRSAAERIAGELGLQLETASRAGAESSFSFEAAPATSVFHWIERMEIESGRTVRSAEIIANDDGTVKASIELSASNSP